MLLEEALMHGTLGAWFPILQTSVAISPAGTERLKRAVTLGKAQVGAFRFLAWGRSSDDMGGDDLRTILLSLAKREDGYDVATDILAMRFHSDRNQKKEHPPALIEAGCALLSSPVFKDPDNMHEYRLRTIASVCLRGVEASAAARSLCERIKQGFTDYSFRSYDHEQLLECIFQLQPRIALDVFFGGASPINGPDLHVDSFRSFGPSKEPIGCSSSRRDASMVR